MNEAEASGSDQEMRIETTKIGANLAADTAPEDNDFISKSDLFVNEKLETHSRRRVSKTLIAACLVSGLCVWQFIQVSKGSGLLSMHHTTKQAGPTKTRSDRHIQSTNLLLSKDPIASFVNRAKRGMTEQEIRWMIEDFEAIGTMPTSGDIDQTRAFRAKQNSWYLTALTEALSLTREQKQAVRSSLTESLDQAMQQFRTTITLEPDKPRMGMVIIMNFEATHWLRSSAFAPWNLCALTVDQSKLTMEHSWRVKSEAVKVAPSPFNQEPQWLGFMSIAMQDPASGNLIDYPPPSPLDWACTMQGTIKGGIIDISEAFPLTLDQKLADHRDRIAAQARLLHPAQLRIGLLLNPSLAQTIKDQLDNPRK